MHFVATNNFTLPL